MNAKIIVSELSRLDRGARERHLLSLGAADRRLRFGLALDDAALHDYVAGIDFRRSPRAVWAPSSSSAWRSSTTR